MKFEWIKLIKNKKNLFVLLLCLGGIFVSFVSIHYYKLNHASEAFDSLKAIYNEIDPPQGTSYEEAKENYKLFRHRDAEGNFYSTKDEKMFKLLLEIVYLLEDENTAEQNKEERQQLSIQTQRLELQQKYIDLGGESWENEQNITEKLVRNAWLKKQQLPLLNSEQNQQGYYFVYHLINQWMDFLLLLIIGLTLFDFLSSEYEKKTVKLIFVQPISKKKFFWQKFTVSSVGILGGIGFFLLIGFVLGTFFEGSGSLNYPIMITQGSGEAFITVGDYILQALILQFLFVLFAVGFLLLSSQVLKRSLEVLAIFLSVFTMPNLIFLLVDFGKNSLYFLPVGYMNVRPILLRMTGSQFLSFSTGFLILLCWNIALWGILGYYFRRKVE